MKHNTLSSNPSNTHKKNWKKNPNYSVKLLETMYSLLTDMFIGKKTYVYQNLGQPNQIPCSTVGTAVVALGSSHCSLSQGSLTSQ
jgi:hypothetical protein